MKADVKLKDTDAVLNSSAFSEDSAADVKTVTDIQSGVVNIAVSDIVKNPLQPRRNFDEESLAGLADSIKANGLIQPVIVSKNFNGYCLIVGERRLRAAQIAGMSEIPAIIRDPGKENVLKLALVENLQRQDLDPIEEAEAFSFLLAEYGFTHEKLAADIGKSRSYITNSVRLLSLPQQIKDDLSSRVLSTGHAKAIMPIVSQAERLSVWEFVKQEHLSVRKTEEYVDLLLRKSSVAENGRKKDKRSLELDPVWKELLEQLRNSFGADVRLNEGSNGEGKLEFHYKNRQELERIVECLVYIKNDKFSENGIH